MVNDCFSAWKHYEESLYEQNLVHSKLCPTSLTVADLATLSVSEVLKSITIHITKQKESLSYKL